MSAIRMMAVFARRVGMTPQAFHDHWRYPHGSLGQGIRIIKRYVQSHQVDVDFLDADQNRYEGIAEVWFDSEADRSEEHTSELKSLMRISYAVFCLKTTHTPTHKQMYNNKMIIPRYQCKTNTLIKQ